MGKIRDLLSLIRPLNCFMAGIAVVFTYLVIMNYRVTGLLPILVGFITGFTAVAASMLINDVVDLDVDRINKPWKPLPRGVFSVSTVKALSIILGLIAVAINILVSPILVLVTLFYTIVGMTYSYLRRFWWSHFLVSLATTGPFIYGLFLATPAPERALFTLLFTLVVFLINSAREFVKSIADYEGDLKQGYMTIATRYGVKKASLVALTFSIAGSLLAVTIGLLGYANIYYTVILLVAGAIFTYSAFSVAIDPSPKKAYRSKNIMIYMMLFALIGFVFSGFA